MSKIETQSYGFTMLVNDVFDTTEVLEFINQNINKDIPSDIYMTEIYGIIDFLAKLVDTYEPDEIIRIVNKEVQNNREGINLVRVIINQVIKPYLKNNQF